MVMVSRSGRRHSDARNSVAIRRFIATPDVRNRLHIASRLSPSSAYARTISHCGISSAAANALASSSMSRDGVRGRLVDRRAPAEQRLLAVAVQTQWPSSWPIVKRRRGGHGRASSALTQISPRAGAAGPESDCPAARPRRAGRRAHVLDVADEQAEDRVGDVLDRDGQRLAVPDPLGDLGEDSLARSSTSSIGRC